MPGLHPQRIEYRASGSLHMSVGNYLLTGGTCQIRYVTRPTERSARHHPTVLPRPPRTFCPRPTGGDLAVIPPLFALLSSLVPDFDILRSVPGPQISLHVGYKKHVIAGNQLLVRILNSAAICPFLCYRIGPPFCPFSLPRRTSSSTSAQVPSSSINACDRTA